MLPVELVTEILLRTEPDYCELSEGQGGWLDASRWDLACRELQL